MLNLGLSLDNFLLQNIFFFFAIKGCYFRENCILFAEKVPISIKPHTHVSHLKLLECHCIKQNIKASSMYFKEHKQNHTSSIPENT